jgi:hypothetical protein
LEVTAAVNQEVAVAIVAAGLALVHVSILLILMQHL